MPSAFTVFLVALMVDDGQMNLGAVVKPHRLHRVHNANALVEITDPFLSGKQSSVT